MSQWLQREQICINAESIRKGQNENKQSKKQKQNNKKKITTTSRPLLTQTVLYLIAKNWEIFTSELYLICRIILKIYFLGEKKKTGNKYVNTEMHHCAFLRSSAFVQIKFFLMLGP